jgi:predicted DNA-binding transcriptional regulator YafY
MSQIKNALIRYRIIDRLIRNQYKPFPSKEELRCACEEFLYGSEDGSNISDSTIEKDLFAMRLEHDAPIKYSKREKGYYYTEEGFSINDIPLSEDEIESIKFATNTLIQFRDSAMFKQFGFAIDKIFDRINISSDPNADDISHLVQFEIPVSSAGNDLLAPLLNAIRHKYVVTFDYASFVNGIKKAREVVALMLKEYRNRWYLISFDLDKSTIITYALERIDNMVITEKNNTSEINFNAEQFFKNAIGITANENSTVENVILKADNISAKYIQSQPFHHSQEVITEGEKQTTFSLQVLISEELIRLILSYSGEVEVVKPIGLRETIVSRIEKMNQIYKMR